MARRPPGGLRVLQVALLVAAGCLHLQAVQADSSTWHSSRDQQQQHGRHLVHAGSGSLPGPSPSSRGRVHQPGLEKAAAAPRPGASEQQVFGSSGLNTLNAMTVEASNTAHQADSTPHGNRPKVPLLAVTVMSAVMALMSCLGVLPYFFFSKLSKPWAGVANAVASGVMLAASFGLLAEGAPYGGTYLILGMLLGVVFVKFSQEHLEQYEVDSFEQLAGADARKVILFLAVMAVHAVGEGGGVGVSFAGDRGWAQGTLVTLAIGLHNVPEGLAVATVMAAKGTSPRRTLLWTALTALPQALVAPPAYVFVDTFRALLPLAMGFAAGCMMWVVLAELLPDALEAIDSEKVATCATGSAAWLQGLSIWIAHLETPAGTLASPFGNYTAVLPLGVTPLLPQLAPIIILPTLLAAAGTRLTLPPVLLTAASAGLMTAYAGAAWLQLLLSSPHKLLGAAVAPAVGAAVAAALWRQLRSWQQQQGWSSGHMKGSSPMVPFAGEVGAAGLISALPLSESPVGGSARDCSHGSEDSSSSSSSSESYYAKTLPAQFPQPGGGMGSAHQQYHPHTQQQQQHVGEGMLLSQVVTTPSEHHLCSSQMRHQHMSDSGAAPAWTHHHQQQQQQQPGVHYQTLDVQQQQQQHFWQQQQPTSGASWDQQSSASSNSSSSSPVRAVGASALLLPGRGDVLLHVGAAAAADSCQGSGRRLFEPRKKRDSWGFAGPGYSRVQGSSQAVAAASMLSVGGAAVTGIPLGLQLAAALTADPTNSGHTVVPMVMLGCLLSLGCLGSLVLLLGGRKRLITAVAGCVGGLPVLVAIAALLSQPAWVSQGSAATAADGLQGLAAGYNLLVLLLLLLPTVKQWGPKAASLGAWCGGVMGVLVSAGVAGLCLGTPYCLHVQASVGAM